MKDKTIKSVIIITLIGNIILTLLKLIFGYIGKSESLVSDGYNSLFDIFISIIMLVIVKISNKTPDKNHPYGHEKYEGVLYLVLSFIIILTSLFLLYSGIIHLVGFLNKTYIIIKPKLYTIVITLLAIIIKVVLYILINYTAKKLNSSILKGDANNHLVDILVTFVALISIFLAQFGFLLFEPLATIIISLFIMYTGIDMIKDSISFLVDEAPDPKIVKAIKQTILNCQGVITVDDLKVRKHMSNFYVDVEIGVSRDLSLVEAHNIAEKVQDIVEFEFSAIHCMVHVNPVKEKKEV